MPVFLRGTVADASACALRIDRAGGIVVYQYSGVRRFDSRQEKRVQGQQLRSQQQEPGTHACFINDKLKRHKGPQSIKAFAFF